ncbi:MAG: CYTH domain-containing protein [Bacteroidetes bacterium]|nr:CYTH domain-containing protein [Bacteroidota bacterium]
MPLEIERKFLVNQEKWNAIEKPQQNNYRQGYLLTDPMKTIRVRVTDTAAFLTIKGLNQGATRLEFEYEIPIADAEALLNNFAVAELIKIRYKIVYKDKLWEVDEFLGANTGLIVAEIELESEIEAFELPPWVDKEVTGDEKYYNSNLSLHPFNTW